MKLAKNHIDIGIWTNTETSLPFWRDKIGLPYEELLKLGGGFHQHRLSLKGSVFKLNHARHPLPDAAPAGFRELMIAADQEKSGSLTDPDGNRVTLVPIGHLDIDHIGMRMATSSVDEAMQFYCDALGAVPLSASHCRWATTVFQFVEEPGIQVPDVYRASDTLRAPGYRYITVQVYKVDSEHERLLQMGATEGSPPTTLGTTARISFIRDPDGNHIEVSQRASLTGDLKPG